MHAPRRFRAAFAATLAVAGAALAGAPAAGAQTPVACPDTFTVLHDDRIGPLALPAGPYRITVRDAARLSCARAADRFRQFLQDYDGRLPRPWTLDAATATFSRGDGAAFEVARAAVPSGSGGTHPNAGARCPGTFQVLHDDRIGRFRVPAGHYSITLLSLDRLSCRQAARRFAAFLQDYDGRLPRPWVLDRETGTFLRGSVNVGFRVKEVASSSGGRGSGVHPAGRVCGGEPFSSEFPHRFGGLWLRPGAYRITALAPNLTCARAERLLGRFLGLPDGLLPRRWSVAPASATFLRAGAPMFRVKLEG